ncbi:hypothetical protein EB796_012304 [Bugula neritina]|uniref:Uncharacterized protein n=1 Tax=Bugula neritina TaxID=10212 RepID=A0A7J7JU32_BUGNE|nr:hypothetical protein EB796_012304 [Bugula neritina]
MLKPIYSALTNSSRCGAAHLQAAIWQIIESWLVIYANLGETHGKVQWINSSIVYKYSLRLMIKFMHVIVIVTVLGFSAIEL